MAAAAALFGALGGAADFGEQHAEATQAARDEVQKRLLQDQQRQAFQQQQMEAQQHYKEEQLRYRLEQQAQPFGPAVTGPGGVVYQRFRNLDGTFSVQQMPGPAAETPMEADARSLRVLGFSEEDIRDITKQSVARTPSGTHTAWVDDPNNPGMQIGTVYGYDGTPIFQMSRTKPVVQSTVTVGSNTDMYGNPHQTYSYHGPATPQSRFQAPYVPFMPRPAMPGAAIPGVGTAIPAPGASPAPGAIPTPGAAPGARAALGFQPQVPPATPQTQSTAALPTSLPPLDQNGLIPPDPRINENIRSLANQAIVNPGTTIPQAADAQVFRLLQHYKPGWIGKLPPASIAAILKIDPVLKQVDSLRKDIENLGLTNNNTSGYLLKSRLQYSVGHAAPINTLAYDIAGLELGSLIEAASALAGASRSMAALDIARKHTPNVWLDSPQQIYNKLDFIRQRLADMEQIARDPYGALESDKPSGAGAAAPPPPAAGQVPPPGAVIRHF
jgi:type II secretory pathway pseudopilin PulG